METLVEASGHGDEESFTNRLLQQSLNQAALQFMLRDPKLHLSGNWTIPMTFDLKKWERLLWFKPSVTRGCFFLDVWGFWCFGESKTSTIGNCPCWQKLGWVVFQMKWFVTCRVFQKSWFLSLKLLLVKLNKWFFVSVSSPKEHFQLLFSVCRWTKPPVNL